MMILSIFYIKNTFHDDNLDIRRNYYIFCDDSKPYKKKIHHKKCSDMACVLIFIFCLKIFYISLCIVLRGHNVNSIKGLC